MNESLGSPELDQANARLDKTFNEVGAALPKIKEEVQKQVSGTETLKNQLRESSAELSQNKNEVLEEFGNPDSIPPLPSLTSEEKPALKGEISNIPSFDDVVAKNATEWPTFTNEDKQFAFQKWAEEKLSSNEKFKALSKEEQNSVIQSAFNKNLKPKSISDHTDWLTGNNDNVVGQFVSGLGKAGSIVTRPFDKTNNEYWSQYRGDSLPGSIGQALGTAGQIGALGAIGAGSLGAGAANLAGGAAINALTGVENVVLDKADPIKEAITQTINTGLQGLGQTQNFIQALGTGVLGQITTSLINTGQVSINELVRGGLTQGFLSLLFHQVGKLQPKDQVQVMKELANAKSVEPDVQELAAKVSETEQKVKLMELAERDARNESFVLSAIKTAHSQTIRVLSQPDPKTGKQVEMDVPVSTNDTRFLRAVNALEARSQIENGRITDNLTVIKDLANKPVVGLSDIEFSKSLIETDIKGRIDLLNKIGGPDSNHNIKLAEAKGLLAEMQEKYEGQKQRSAIDGKKELTQETNLPKKEALEFKKEELLKKTEFMNQKIKLKEEELKQKIEAQKELETLKLSGKIEINEKSLLGKEALQEKTNDLKRELLDLKYEQSSNLDRLKEENLSIKNDLLKKKIQKSDGIEGQKKEVEAPENRVEKAPEDFYKPGREPRQRRYEAVDFVPSMYGNIKKVAKTGRVVDFEFKAKREEFNSSGRRGEFIEPEPEKHVTVLGIEFYDKDILVNGIKGTGNTGYYLKGINNNYEVRYYDMDNISNIGPSDAQPVSRDFSIPVKGLKDVLLGKSIEDAPQQVKNFVKKAIDEKTYMSILNKDYIYQLKGTESSKAGFKEYLEKEGLYSKIQLPC